jgi:hypothetical protein
MLDGPVFPAKHHPRMREMPSHSSLLSRRAIALNGIELIQNHGEDEMKLTQAIIDDPYVLHATRARVTNHILKIELASKIQVIVPLAVLGEPWTEAGKKQLANIRLEGDGLVLDEVLPAMLGMKPGAMLARLARGKSTPKKAAAARANGRSGGRPPKIAVRRAAAVR